MFTTHAFPHVPTGSVRAPIPQHLLSQLTVMTRRVRADARQLDARLAPLMAPAAPPIRVGDAGRLELIVRLPTRRTEAWRFRARLSPTCLRLVRYTRVEIDVTMWSGSTGELTLRPIARNPLSWGTRRLRRYLAVAPLAADLLAAIVTTPMATETADPALGDRFPCTPLGAADDTRALADIAA